MSEFEDELKAIKSRVARSKLNHLEKVVCYSAISDLARLLESDGHGQAN